MILEKIITKKVIDERKTRGIYAPPPLVLSVGKKGLVLEGLTLPVPSLFYRHLEPRGGQICPDFIRSSITFFAILFSKITIHRIIVWVLGVFYDTNHEFRIYGTPVEILDANEGLDIFSPFLYLKH